MTPDPELISETRAWFKKAAHDIRVAELALRDDPAMTDQTVYHAQQAAEKAMKGLLTWHERILNRFFAVPPVFQTMPGSIVIRVI